MFGCVEIRGRGCRLMGDGWMDGWMFKWREECLPFRGIYAIAMLLSSPGTLARYVRSPCW